MKIMSILSIRNRRNPCVTEWSSTNNIHAPRVTFKIATLMHQILQKRCPSYLANLHLARHTYSSDLNNQSRRRTTHTNSVLEACVFCLRS